MDKILIVRVRKREQCYVHAKYFSFLCNTVAKEPQTIFPHNLKSKVKIALIQKKSTLILEQENL